MPPGKDKDALPSAEISRLSALVAKDPGSKLFIPLAEEYMKAGMTDQAVTILERGLKANPFYMSARVMLGKAHLEKGNADKARGEFEQVVKAIPDNLFAHRKLGEIYMGQGMRAEAVRAFRMVAILNPTDEQAKRYIEEMEAGVAPATEAPAEGQTATVEPHIAAESAPQEDVQSPLEAPEPEDFDIAEPPVYELDKAGEPETEEPQAAVFEMPVPEMETIESLEQPPPEAVMDEDLVAEVAVEAEAEAEEEEAERPAPAYSLDVPGDVGLQEMLSAYAEAVPDEEEIAPKETGGVYEIAEDISSFDIEGLAVESHEGRVEELPAVEGPQAVEAPQAAEAPQDAKDVFETKTLAELYVSQGFYDRAIGIYKNLLMDEPGNIELKTKLEEVYRQAGAAAAEGASAATEGMPAKNEEAIRRLEQFMEGIRRKAGR